MLQCVAVPNPSSNTGSLVCGCMCCSSVLQCVAVCCGVMQCGTVPNPSSNTGSLVCGCMCCSSVLQCVAVCCSVLQCVAVPNPSSNTGSLTHPLFWLYIPKFCASAQNQKTTTNQHQKKINPTVSFMRVAPLQNPKDNSTVSHTKIRKRKGETRMFQMQFLGGIFDTSK